MLVSLRFWYNITLMEVIDTPINDVKILKPTIFGDRRGFFLESFNQDVIDQRLGKRWIFVQDNHSRSLKNVLRGLHYQLENPQGKLVRVVSGTVFDVAVDLRRSSPTFGKSTSVILSDENQLLFWIPPGFAHAFLVLSESADFLYKATEFYHPQSERTILWNDPDLAIQWPEGVEPLLSSKDQKGQRFADAEVFA